MNPIPPPKVVLAPIPNDLVDITVDGSMTNCPSLQPVLAAWNGVLTLRISQLIQAATLNFAAGAVRCGPTPGARDLLALAWHNLMHLRPRVVPSGPPNRRRRRLVVDEVENSRFRAVLTEYLAAAVGLLAACRLTSIRMQHWYVPPKLPPYDFHTRATTTGPLLLETRGRFNRKQWQSALDQVAKKRKKVLKAGRPFRHYIGAVFAPRSGAGAREADLWIEDPSGSERTPSRDGIRRGIVLHYARVMLAMGHQQVARDLESAVSREVKWLRRYRTVASDLRRLTSAGGGIRDVGSRESDHFGSTAPSRGQETPSRVHVLIRPEIARALVDGDLDRLGDARHEEVSFVEGDRAHIVSEDGVELTANVSDLSFSDEGQ